MKINYMLLKTTECLSMSLIAHKKGGFFVSLAVWNCFWLVPACYILFRIVPLFTNEKSQNIVTCIFIINQLHADIITQWDSFFTLKIGASSSNYKARQLLLQRGAIITK